MLNLSCKATGIAPSQTLAIDTRAKALKEEGKDVVGFGVGEPDFDTPAYIREAGKRAIDEGKTRYTPVPGTLTLRKKIAEKFLKENGLSYKPSEILVSSGAKQSIFTALAAILNEGDEVLIPSPYWVSYPEMVKMVGGVPVYVPTSQENDFRVRAEDVRALATEKTKALILNSPSNPNGCVLPEETLRELATVAVEKQFYVISDEIYEKLVYDGEKHVSIASFGDQIKAQTIVINGASKAYAMTGWRIGYAAGPANVLQAMSAYQSHAASNACTISQYATEAALSGGEEEISQMVAAFDARRKLIHKLVNDVPQLSAFLPKGAFYIMVDVSGILGKKHRGKAVDSAQAFAELLLDEEFVAVVPGEAFGAPGFIRLSYATSEERIQEGIRRMGAFVAKME